MSSAWKHSQKDFQIRNNGVSSLEMAAEMEQGRIQGVPPAYCHKRVIGEKHDVANNFSSAIELVQKSESDPNIWFVHTAFGNRDVSTNLTNLQPLDHVLLLSNRWSQVPAYLEGLCASVSWLSSISPECSIKTHAAYVQSYIAVCVDAVNFLHHFLLQNEDKFQCMWSAFLTGKELSWITSISLNTVKGCFSAYL